MKWFYVGVSKEPEKRLAQHNRGLTSSTKSYAPLQLVFTKEFSTFALARDYERFLKIRSNKEKVLRQLNLI